MAERAGKAVKPERIPRPPVATSTVDEPLPLLEGKATAAVSGRDSGSGPAAEGDGTDGSRLESRHAALLRTFAKPTGQSQRLHLMRHLQRGYGNAHVARVVARLQATGDGASAGGLLQRVDCPPAAVEKPPVEPQQDAAFKATESKLTQVATKEKAHPPAASKAAEAQAAAVGPANETASQAKAGQVDKMGQQQPGTFNKAAFVAAVQQAVAAAAPKDLSEAGDYTSSGKAGQVKAQVSGQVRGGKETAEKDIKQTTNAAPDASKATPKPVTPMKPEQAGPAPGPIGAQSSMPLPKPAEEIDLRHDQCDTDAQMKEADVTDEQLQKSNEPQFQEALDAKQQASEHTASAPAEYKADEQAVLGQARAAAGAEAAQGTGAMHTSRAGALAHVMRGKATGKSADEAKRAKVAGELEAIYGKTKTDVTQILDGIEGKVNPIFDAGEQAARQAMETHIETRTDRFKDERYSGVRGKLRWLKDKFSAPPELNQFVDEGVKLYMGRMNAVIDRIADLVGAELTRAKARIAQGRQEIQTYVVGLPKELQKVGKETASDIEGKFDELDQQVETKQQGLVDSLAQKYVEARDKVNERAKAMKEANKGLWDRAKDFVNGVIETIKKLKEMLLNVLAKAASFIGKIIKDPIGFLGNLVGAIKQGLNQFVGNIGKHLKAGLMGWLFGTLAEAGIQMPESFDLKGILSLVLQLLGVTYANIRARAVKVVGEKAMAGLEKTVDIFKTLVTEGPAGLWKFIQEKLASLKETMLGQVIEFVRDKIITAGITWLLSMLNPASAFIRACKMIYDVVMFFVERGSQIMGLVNAVLDGIGQIAAGAIGGAANLVEQALAKAVPVAISFLASLLGLGGIAGKIKSIIEAIQAPINKAIDAVVGGALKLFKKLGGDKIIGAVQKGITWGKDKIKQGKEWVTKKAQGAKDFVTGKARGLAGKDPNAQPSAADRAAVETKARKIVTANEGVRAPVADLISQLSSLKSRYGWIKGFTAEPKGPGHYTIVMRDIIDDDYTAAEAEFNGRGPVSVERLRSEDDATYLQRLERLVDPSYRPEAKETDDQALARSYAASAKLKSPEIEEIRQRQQNSAMNLENAKAAGSPEPGEASLSHLWTTKTGKPLTILGVTFTYPSQMTDKELEAAIQALKKGKIDSRDTQRLAELNAEAEKRASRSKLEDEKKKAGKARRPDNVIVREVLSGAKYVWCFDQSQAQAVANIVEQIAMRDAQREAAKTNEPWERTGSEGGIHGPEKHLGVQRGPRDIHINASFVYHGTNTFVDCHIHFAENNP